MSKSKRYEGKAKILCPLQDFEGELPPHHTFPANAWVQKFKDDLTAFNALKKSQRAGKGSLNQKISQILFQYLEACGFKTHYIASIDDTHQVIHHLDMIPLECVVRRIATGSLVKRIGVEEGKRMHPPLFEIFLKDDVLQDPLLTREQVCLVHPSVGKSLVQKLELLTVSIFGHLEALFHECGLDLIDGKFEFGLKNQEIVLGDEITPDTLRIWKNGKRLDKDVFRHDLGDVLEGYGVIHQLLEKVDLQKVAHQFVKNGIPSAPYVIVCEVVPQEEVLDPEGQAVWDVLRQSELSGVQEVKMGKRVAMQFDRVLSGYGLSQLEQIGSRLFANPLIQEWQFYLDRV